MQEGDNNPKEMVSSVACPVVGSDGVLANQREILLVMTEAASKKRCVGDRETRWQATWVRWVGVGWGQGC